MSEREDMETPALTQLMGAYLHQDYDLVGDEWDNLNAFIEESSILAAQLPDEVAWALRAHQDEPHLALFVETLGCQLAPPAGGYRAWLTEIARRVAAATA